MMSLDKKILARIERENLKVRPKWYFKLKDSILAVLAFLLTVMGSAAFALAANQMAQNLDQLAHFSRTYFWLVGFSLLAFGAYRIFLKIGPIYKLKLSLVASLVILMNLSFGYLTFANGGAQKLENNLQKIQAYRSMFTDSEKAEIDGITIPAPKKIQRIEEVSSSEGNSEEDENKDKEDESDQEKDAYGGEEDDIEDRADEKGVESRERGISGGNDNGDDGSGRGDIKDKDESDKDDGGDAAKDGENDEESDDNGENEEESDDGDSNDDPEEDDPEEDESEED